MTKSDVDESLTQLYLRLNGYFTTGFIVHSTEWGQARTEVDCLAVRHPYYSEPERQIGPSEFLGMNQDEVDLILCEVKSDPQMIGFNRALKEDSAALASILRRSGLFPEKCLTEVIARLHPLLQDEAKEDCAKTGIVEANARIRPLLCCPSATDRDSQRWCLKGSEILHFLSKCFNPDEPRDSCSSRYNFQQWGRQFEPIVRHIKQNATGASLSGLYKIFDVE
ncbi:hypothetical protein [Salinisphaera orenii]|uniref:hypothetical protein n=1 Tax=Salinisphaera orenii TaxID=856731 RepID=UPI0011CD5855|nr:hypothetical protein [Salinisphaera halophila]